MSEVTEKSLIEVMTAIAGDALDTERGDTRGTLNRCFGDLGFDSLARQELVGRLERIHGTMIDPDIELTDEWTPGELLNTFRGQDGPADPASGTPSWRIVLELEIVPELAAEFERVWSEVGTTVSAEPANTGQWLMRDAQDRDRYYVISDWTTRAEFERFERSARHLHHRQLLHPYRRGGSMRTMDIVAHLPGGQHN